MLEAVGDVFIVVREGFDKACRVAGLEAVVALLVCNLHVAGAVAQAHVTTQVAGLECFGLQLEPFGAAVAAVHADAQAIAVAESRLAEPYLGAHVVRVLRQGADVIDDLREEPEGGLVGDDAFGAFSGQEENHVVQVATEVERNLGNHGVLEAPALRLGRLVVCPQAHEAFLRHFHLHLLDLAELAVGDELLEFTHHRVTGVVVSGAEETFRFGDDLRNRFAFLDARGEGLFADDGEPGLECVDDDILVQVRGREYHDGIELALFGFQEFAVITVSAFWGYAPGCGGLLVRLGVGAERARHEFEMPVHLACRFVDFADGRIDTASDKGDLVGFLLHVM